MTFDYEQLDLMAAIADHLERELGNPERPSTWPLACEVMQQVEQARSVIERERAQLVAISRYAEEAAARRGQWSRELDQENAPVLRNSERVKASDLEVGDTLLIRAATGRYRTARVTGINFDDYYSREVGRPVLGIERTGRSTPEPFDPEQWVERKIRR